MENKRKIDEYISKAIEVLNNNEKIVKEGGKIDKTFSGQIATFAVAVSTGSLLSAVAFFSDNGGASNERSSLMDVIYKIVIDENSQGITNQENDSNINSKLLEHVKNKYKEFKLKNDIVSYNRVKEDILNAAIAIKLAMNFYELVDNSNKG
jgi:hypothetical protein